MRLLGRIAPGSGVGDAGHFAAWRRPNATVDLNVVESCLLRLGSSVGVIVSAAPVATEGGGATGVLVAAESALVPWGEAADSGSALSLAHAAISATANATVIWRRIALMNRKLASPTRTISRAENARLLSAAAQTSP